MTGLTLVAVRKVESLKEPDLSPVHALLDFLAEGSNLSPRIREAEATPLLAELLGVAADLASRQRARAVVRLCTEPDPWDLGLERSGRDVLISVFHGGGMAEVASFERRVDGDLFAAKILAAASAHERGPIAPPTSLFQLDQDRFVTLGNDGPGRLAACCERLQAALPFGDAPSVEAESVAIEPTGEVPIVIAAEVQLRVPEDAGQPPAVQRADLFSLLFRGRLKITVGEHAREMQEDVFVFLVAEQLAAITLEAIEAWSRGRPYYRRLTVGGAICGVKLGSEGAASLTLGLRRRPSEARTEAWTFPAVDLAALAQGVVAFGRALTRSLQRRDRAQTQNLRLHVFRAKIRELSDRLRDATRNDSKINDAPESYRAFAASVRPSAPSMESFGRTRLRFTSRWIAAVPSIDLRSTFLCGDRMILGATREISCLDTRTGAPLWTRPTPRAVGVMTPLGLARIEGDGTLSLIELGQGEIAWSTKLSPRVGHNASGAVVSAPGLPRLLIVSEGTRHLAAVDLHGGEVRWRFAARRGGVFRLRRAGKLVIVGSGDPALTALDVLTGEVVWRVCDRLRFAAPVAVDHDALFALAGGGAFVGRGGARLHHVDPWSGVVRWSVDLPDHVSPVGAPLLGPETVVVVTHGRGGTGLVGFDRRTGALAFDQMVTASAASCLMVDGTVIVNSEGGELVAVSAADGKARYRHVFSGGAEGDRPRRLEPVLRSGALFVPQSEEHVVRPSDGTLLGKVPADIIPDLLRVDERCDVYVAEESGHVAAYSAAPRLTLVTPVNDG
ncbi:MAG: PQQ-binding-like beta-propeller repeat protein [Byssovorax sp.]